MPVLKLRQERFLSSSEEIRMRSRGSLSHYLDELGSEGSFDSSGGFTMLEINALEKLARYTLTDKEDWLLKVVQAAVVARSKVLDIKILRSTVEVRFDFPGGEEWEDVARSVVDLSQTSGPFAEHLNIALRTLLSHHRFCLLSVHSGALFWDGEGLHRVEPEHYGAELTLVVDRRRLGDGSSWFASGPARDAVKYERVLKQRAGYAPLRLALDGREISPLTVPAGLRGADKECSDATSVLLVRRDSETTASCTESSFFSDGLRAEKPLLVVGQPWRGDRGRYYEMLWSAYSHARLYVLLLRHGVVCEKAEVPMPALSYFVVDCDELPTDVSGLRLRWEQEDVATALKELSNVMRGHELLDDVLAAYKPDFHITARTTVRATVNFFATGVAGGLLGLISTFTPIGGGVCFLLAGISGAVGEIRRGPDEIVDLKRLALAQKDCLRQQVLKVNARQSRE